MKFLITSMMLLTAVLASKSYAGSSLVCHSPMADAGYRIEFSENMKKAAIEEVTIAGSTHLADLNCSVFEPTYYRDLQLPTVRCSEPYLRDAGYSLVVRENPTTGEFIAILSEVSFIGSKVVGRLSCTEMHKS